MAAPTAAPRQARRGASGWLAAGLSILGAIAPSGHVTAQTPTAIVEDVSGVGDLRVMQYVYPGRRLVLGADQHVVLGYLASCLIEAITGGEVTVGTERSQVIGGIVQRHKVECSANRLLLTREETERSGAMVYRDPLQPQVTIFGLSPAISLTRPATIRLQRIDQPGRVVEIEMTGLGADLAEQGIVLVPNGIYRASIGDRPIVTFRVDPDATDHAPLIARLLQL